jgi:predicted transglutaminase-like cysteine proteinase
VLQLCRMQATRDNICMEFYRPSSLNLLQAHADRGIVVRGSMRGAARWCLASFACRNVRQRQTWHNVVAYLAGLQPWLWRSLSAGFVVLLLWASASLAWDVQRLMAAGQRKGAAGVNAASALTELLNYLGSVDDPIKLATVNVFFNRRIVFRDDIQAWGEQDYWASPLETMVKGEGDCEDYAIAKYLSLLAAGMEPQRLRMVYVRARVGAAGSPPVAHMVLAYYPSKPDGGHTVAADPWILDNLVNEIKPAAQRPDLTPVFSFSVEGLWQGTTSNVVGDPLARLSRWRDLLAKAREEGLP